MVQASIGHDGDVIAGRIVLTGTAENVCLDDVGQIAPRVGRSECSEVGFRAAGRWGRRRSEWTRDVAAYELEGGAVAAIVRVAVDGVGVGVGEAVFVIGA